MGGNKEFVEKVGSLSLEEGCLFESRVCIFISLVVSRSFNCKLELSVAARK